MNTVPKFSLIARQRTLLKATAIALLTAFFAANVSAQTLMLQFDFEDTGTTTMTTTNSAASVSLNIVNAAGTAADLHGAAGSGVGGFGQALDFTSAPGSTAAAPLAFATNNNALGFGSVGSWTVTEWVKPVTGANLANALARFLTLGVNGTVDGATANSIGAQMENNGLSLRMSINSGNRISTGLVPALALNTWSFIAYTYDGTTLRMYTGSETTAVTNVASVALSAAQAAPNFGASGSIMLGNRMALTRGLKGYIDDFRFYTGAGDLTFVETVRLAALGGPVVDPFVGNTTLTPAGTVYPGTTVTLSAGVSGTAPFTAYVWQSDGQSGGVTWTNLPGSTTNFYALDTTGMSAGTNQYRLVVTGAAGKTTNTPGSLVVAAPSGPIVVANTTISPAIVAAGGTVTISAAFTGSPTLYYQWLFAGTNGIATNIPGATSNVFTLAEAQYTNAGSYSLVASNNLGGIPSVLTNTPATLTVRAPFIISDFGAADPVPGTFDIAQLSTAGGTTTPDGLASYKDLDNSPRSGQTFTTPAAFTNGYVLDTVYVKLSDASGHNANRPYILRIYSLAGVTLLSTYTNDNVSPAIGIGDWMAFSGLTNVLSTNTTYAYSVQYAIGGNSRDLGSASGNPYPGGQVCKIPDAGGSLTLGGGAFDATFMVHLLPVGYPIIQSVSISPTNSPSSPVYAPTPVTLSVFASATDPSPLHYQWQTDNGSGGASFVDLSGSDTSSYALDTSGLTPATAYQYRVIVTNDLNGSSPATSSIVTLNWAGASAPVLLGGATLTPSVTFVGNSVLASATFAGSPPLFYQWKFTTNGGGTSVISGATNAALTLSNAQFASAGSYFVTASNNPPSLGAQTSDSAPARLYVVLPPVTNSTTAGIFDAGSSAPTPGAYDISQLIANNTGFQPIGLNYAVDATPIPGQIFTTSNASTAGYMLNTLYVKHDSLGSGGGFTNVQAYTLRVYQVLGGSNAALITSYVSTNTLTFPAGDWVRWEGLTNTLQTNTAYAFSLARNGSGWWKLEASFGDLYPVDGEAVSLPASAGPMTFSANTGYDAAFLVGLTPLAPVTNSVNANPTNLTFSANGGNLNLAWPSDHIGWRLQVQTNSRAVGLKLATNTWFDVPGSAATNLMVIPVSPANPAVFYRLRLVTP